MGEALVDEEVEEEDDGNDVVKDSLACAWSAGSSVMAGPIRRYKAEKVRKQQLRACGLT